MKAERKSRHPQMPTPDESDFYLRIKMCREVLPGDTVEMDAAFLGRTAPTVTPIMDNVFFDTQWFFVPSRIIWNNFTICNHIFIRN